MVERKKIVEKITAQVAWLCQTEEERAQVLAEALQNLNEHTPDGASDE